MPRRDHPDKVVVTALEHPDLGQPTDATSAAADVQYDLDGRGQLAVQRSAVEAVAKLDARNEGANILADIHKSMVKAHGEAMDDYRKASAERHSLLRRMMPDWLRET